MQADTFSISYDSSARVWKWTRLPNDRKAALTRYSHENFSSIKDAVAAAKSASFGNGVFCMPFDDGVGGVHTWQRGQYLIQQLCEVRDRQELRRAILALFSYNLEMYESLLGAEVSV